MPDNELLKLTISEIAPMIQAREVSPVDLTEAALAEAERRQPTLNSFITIMREQAMEQAEQAEDELSRGQYRGPLHGIPIGIKDNIATSGIKTTLGTRVLKDHVPDEDAEVVRRSKEAGAIILGKENLEEFAAGATSNNPHYGAVHNPLGPGPRPRRFQRRRRSQRCRRRDLCVAGNRPGRVGALAGRVLRKWLA